MNTQPDIQRTLNMPKAHDFEVVVKKPTRLVRTYVNHLLLIKIRTYY